jgi:hypothetical protein
MRFATWFTLTKKSIITTVALALLSLIPGANATDTVFKFNVPNNVSAEGGRRTRLIGGSDIAQFSWYVPKGGGKTP